MKKELQSEIAIPSLRHSMTYTLQFHDMETGHPELITVPDQSLSLSTLLERSARGLPVSASQRQPLYSENDWPEFEKMDLAERQEYREKIAAEMLDLQEQHRAATTIIEKQKQAEKDAAFEKYILDKNKKQEASKADSTNIS